MLLTEPTAPNRMANEFPIGRGLATEINVVAIASGAFHLNHPLGVRAMPLVVALLTEPPRPANATCHFTAWIPMYANVVAVTTGALPVVDGFSTMPARMTTLL